jgi:hypothetical protein
MMRLNKPKLYVFLFLIVAITTGAWGQVTAFDLEIIVPDLTFTGALAGYNEDALSASVFSQLESDFLAIESEIGQYTELPNLASGFANAGAATAQEGFLRGSHDIKVFSISLGTSAAVTLPNLSFLNKIDSANFIEDEGDVYAGIATQPFNVTATFNLGFLVSGLRGMAKFGYADIPEGLLGEGYSFNALSVGAGLSYQLIEPKSVPLGVVRWRGLAVASGLFYQRNTTEITITDAGDIGINQALTMNDIGDTGNMSVIGYFTSSPFIVASIESSTYTIPLQVSTGLRLLYIIDLNVGAGVDIVFGQGKINLKSTQSVDFEVEDAYAGEIDVTAGSINISDSTSGDPDFARPHLMASLGLAMGPVRLEVPLKYYFDKEGNTYVTGFTFGVLF